MHFITSSKLFRYTWVNKFTFIFLTWSVNGKTKQHRQIRCSGVFRLFRCSGVPGFSTCRSKRWSNTFIIKLQPVTQTDCVGALWLNLNFIELNLNWTWIELELSLNWNWIFIELKLNFHWIELEFHWIEFEFQWIEFEFHWIELEFHWIEPGFRWIEIELKLNWNWIMVLNIATIGLP